jgi:hypothetical protein
MTGADLSHDRQKVTRKVTNKTMTMNRLDGKAKRPFSDIVIKTMGRGAFLADAPALSGEEKRKRAAPPGKADHSLHPGKGLRNEERGFLRVGRLWLRRLPCGNTKVYVGRLRLLLACGDSEPLLSLQEEEMTLPWHGTAIPSRAMTREGSGPPEPPAPRREKICPPTFTGGNGGFCGYG